MTTGSGEYDRTIRLELTQAVHHAPRTVRPPQPNGRDDQLVWPLGDADRHWTLLL